MSYGFYEESSELCGIEEFEECSLLSVDTCVLYSH